MLIYGHLISTFVLYDNMLIYGHLISTFVLYDNMLIYGHSRDRRGRDRMVVGFTTYVISAYHHWCCEIESRSGRGAQHYVVKFVSALQQVGGFLRIFRFPPPIKLNITEILLKVALSNTKQAKKQTNI
jgi:hypothetical protein